MSNREEDRHMWDKENWDPKLKRFSPNTKPKAKKSKNVETPARAPLRDITSQLVRLLGKSRELY